MVAMAPLEGPQSLSRATLLIALPLVAILLFLGGNSLISPSSDRLAAMRQSYHGSGPAYKWPSWHNDRTVAVETLGETKFARCDLHTVRDALVSTDHTLSFLFNRLNLVFGQCQC